MDTSTSAVDFDRVLTLFRGPNSAALYDRHIAAIDKLCRTNTTGFAIRDLPKAQQILELTLELLKNGAADFLQPTLELLRVLSKPFLRRTSTDEFKMLNNITNILTSIGSIFSPQFPVVLQVAAAQFLDIFSTAYGNAQGALEPAAAANELDAGSGPRQFHTNQTLVGRSGIIKSILRGLSAAILTADMGLQLALTSTLLKTSYLHDNCSQMLDGGLLQCMPHLLNNDFKDVITPVAIELLWNVLERAPETKDVLPMSLPGLTSLIKDATRPSSRAVMQESEQVQRPSSSSQPQLQQQLDEEPEADTQCGADGEGSTTAEAGDPSQQGLLATELDPNSAAEAGQGPDDTLQPPEAPGSVPRTPLTDDQQTSGATPEPDATLQAQTAAGPRPTSSSSECVVAPLAAALSALFQVCLLNGFRAVDKELRNDVLVVINLLLEVPEFSHACLDVGFFDAALAVATSPELGDHPDLVKGFCLTQEDVDHELRLLAWNAVVQGCQLPDVLQQAVEGGLVRVLMMYIDLTEQSAAVKRWNADHFTALRTSALSKLHTVAPQCAAEYMNVGGVRTMLDFVQTRGVIDIHVEAALRHLYRICELVPEMRETLGAAGAIKVMLDVASDHVNKPEGVRHFALMNLSVLCFSAPENMRRLRKEQGVQVLLSLLSKAKALDASVPSPFIVALLDAIWTCIVPDRKNAARFLVEDGMDELLNLLELGNAAHRPVILGVIADMLQNPKSHSFFHEWQSDRNKQTAAHLLLRLWTEEDQLRGMTKEGVLTNTSKPLSGTQKRAQWIPQETVAYGNLNPTRKNMLQTFLDSAVGEQLLAKIYAVFKLLGFDKFSYLSQQEQCTMCLVEKYVKFRQGSVWQEIKAEFEATGMRPTRPDRERLASGIELAEHLAKAVKDAQAGILNRHRDKQQEGESKFYEDMRQQRKLEQEARFYQKDKSQMTMAELRDAKMKKEQMLKNSITSFQLMGGGDEDLQSTGGTLVGEAVLAGTQTLPPLPTLTVQ